MRGGSWTGLPLVGGHGPAVDADDRLSLPGDRPGRALVAQRDRAAPGRPHRPRRLPDRRRFRPAGLAGRPGLLPGLPGPVRERRPEQRRHRRSVDLPRPCHAPPSVGCTAGHRARGAGRVLRWRPGRPRVAAGSPRAARRQRDLPEPDLRDSLEPRLRHHRLRDGGAAFRRGRGAGRPPTSCCRPRHPAHPRHRSQPRRRGASVVPGRPVRSGRRDRGLLHLPRAAGRLRVVARSRLAAQAGLSQPRPAGGDVRRPGRDPAALDATPLLRRRLAHRRREHARAARTGPARGGGGTRHAPGDQGGGPRRVPDRRAFVRRDRAARRRPMGRGDELRGVPVAGPRLARRHRAPRVGWRAVPAGRARRRRPT